MIFNDLEEFHWFQEWVGSFELLLSKEASDRLAMDVNHPCMIASDYSFIEVTPSGFHVMIGNSTRLFNHLPEAITHLWRNHAVYEMKERVA